MKKRLFALFLLVAAGAHPAWAISTTPARQVSLPDTAVKLPLLVQNDIKSALAVAATRYQSVIVLFSSPDCQWCSRLKDEVFTDPGVVDMLQNYVFVEIDVTANADAARLYQVQGVPTVLIISSSGEIRTGFSGYITPSAFQKFLRSALNPEFLKQKEASYLELLKMLDDNSVPTNSWPAIMSELGAPERRKELHSRILNLSPFPRKEIVALLNDNRLAVRLGALEIVEELVGDVSGYDPWLDESSVASNRTSLARLQAWADDTKPDQTASLTSVFSALTREQISSYIQDLISDDSDRSVRALRMLANGGQNVFQALTEFLQGNPDLSAGAKNRVKEVQYTLCIAWAGRGDASILARKLLFGTLDVRMKALAQLHAAGVYAIPILKEFLEDRDAIVRETAVDAILGAGGARAIPVLKDHLAREKDKDVIYGILVGLSKIRNRAGLDILTSYLNNPNEDLVVAALNSIAKIKSATVHQEVARSLADPRWRVRVAALEAVGALKLSNLDGTVAEMLKDKDPFVRYSAVKALTSIAAKKAAPRLEEVFLREDELKGPIVEAFGSMELAVPASFGKAIEGKSPDIVLPVIEALKDCGEKDLKLAERFLDDDNLDVACAATRLIASKGTGNSRFRARMVKILQSGRRELILAVLESMRANERDEILSAASSASLQPAGIGMLDAVLEAFTEAQPITTQATNQAAPSAGKGVTDRDVFSAFTETEPQDSTGASTGGTVRVATEAGMPDLIRAVENTLESAADEEIRFQAALFLVKVGNPKAIPLISSSLSSRTAAERTAVAESLARGTGTNTLPLLRQLLQDPSDEIRGAAASACLQKTKAGTVFFEAVLAELTRPGTKFRPWNLPLSYLDYMADQGGWRRIAGEWARRTAAETREPALRNLALILLEHSWKSTDTKLVGQWIHSDDPWQRRAALHALGVGDPKAFKSELSWVCKDPSEFVRAVIPAVYMRGSGNWIHYLDTTRFQPGRDYRSYMSSLNDSTKIPAEARDALLTLTGDDAPAVRVEACFCLLSNRETIDLVEFIRTIGSLPDQRSVSERVANFLTSNYQQLGQGFRVLIPFLEKSRHEDAYLDRVRKHFKIDSGKADESFSVITRTAESAPVPATFLEATPAAGQAGSNAVRKIVYFTTPGCQGCEKAERMLRLLRDDFPALEIETLNVRKLAAMRVNEALCEKFRVAEGSRLIAPAVFGGGGYLIKNDISDESLHELVIRSTAVPLKDWYDIPGENLARADSAITRRYSAMGIGVVATAGFLDGVNPCAFATIIFLLSYLQISRREPREVLRIGAAFIVGVFLAYFVLGLGLIEIILKAQKVLSWLRTALNWGLAGFSLVIMALSFRDGILCLQGRLQDITLQLPGVLKTGIHGVIRHGARQTHFVVAAFVVGIAISVLELACTGQVYLPTIAYMLEKGGNSTGAISYLLLYNIAFIMPLIVIFVIARFGLTSEGLSRFLKKHAAIVKFSTAALFLLLFLFFAVGNLMNVNLMGKTE